MKVRFLPGFLISLLLLTGCPPNMSDQPKYEVMEESTFFADGGASRPLPEGVLPRGYLRDNPLVYEGTIDGQPATHFPEPVSMAMLERGQEQFNIYCIPCHGATGHGDGMIVQRGFPAPPSYHTEELREAPPGYLFQVITNGKGLMFPYDYRVEPEDRWAIVAYIRALQLSQQMSVEELPASVRTELEAQP